MTTLFGNTAVPNAVPVTETPAPKRRGWLPLLTVLFLISYGLMTMLIVEQGSTIESQRVLIRELFRDSTELSATKMKAQQERAQALAAQTQGSVTQNPSSQSSSGQCPSTQAQANRTPSSQAGPQQHAQNQATKQKPQPHAPTRPASDLSDARTLIKI